MDVWLLYSLRAITEDGLLFMDRTTISVVIPTYNVAEHFARAIESVLDQKRAPAEILIVDDCSTDCTLSVAQSFSDPRIKIIPSLTNNGSASARNIGIRAADGDLIAMLDGDDYWHDDHLAIVAGLLDQHPSANLAFSATQAFGAQSWVWPIRIPSHQPTNCFWECVPRTIIPQMNVVMRRQTVLAANGYRETLSQSQDYDLFMRLAIDNLFVCTEEVTSGYRRHEGSITVRNPQNALHCMYRARELFAAEMADRMPSADLAKFRAMCLQLWETELTNCVIRRNWRLMDFHLSQAIHVPGAENAILGWRLRRAAGTVQWIWNVANRPLRRAS